MEANELRIGNLVEYTGRHRVNNVDNWYYKVACISLRDIGLYDVLGMVDKEDITPIPLTPEILVKCGFVYKHEFYTIGKDLISFIFNDGKLQCTFIIIDTPFRQINYLHQLQNLYYALTGKELEFKQ